VSESDPGLGSGSDASGVEQLDDDLRELVEGALDGQQLALSRLISHIENKEPGYREAMTALYPESGDARIIGITGQPGAGKSTLVDKIVDRYRERGLSVGVIAVDPSSPYSGGSVLGDRIRQTSRNEDPEVFFRSMSSRGQGGGLAAATFDVIHAMDAFGKDVVLIETVGAGQNEVDIVSVAETVCVVTIPGAGDDIQANKAGILEIADVFAVNKADLDGAHTTRKELMQMVRIGNDLDDGDERRWLPPIELTTATRGEGVEELLEAFDDHYGFLTDTGRLEAERAARFRQELRTHLDDELSGLVDRLVEVRAREDTDPHTAAQELLAPLRAAVEAELDRD
jgi:LAO/AO transport system kinase